MAMAMAIDIAKAKAWRRQGGGKSKRGTRHGVDGPNAERRDTEVAEPRQGNANLLQDGVDGCDEVCLHQTRPVVLHTGGGEGSGSG